MLVKKLSNIGNSQGVIIDKSILDMLDVTADTPLQLDTDGDVIILRPLRVRRTELRTLADSIMDDNDDTFRKLAQ